LTVYEPAYCRPIIDLLRHSFALSLVLSRIASVFMITYENFL